MYVVFNKCLFTWTCWPGPTSWKFFSQRFLLREVKIIVIDSNLLEVVVAKHSFVISFNIKAKGYKVLSWKWHKTTSSQPFRANLSLVNMVWTVKACFTIWYNEQASKVIMQQWHFQNCRHMRMLFCKLFFNLKIIKIF